MRYTGLGAIAGMAVAMLGCTTDKAAQQMQSSWVGKSTDSFFIANGPPIGSFTLSDGRTLYTWRSRVSTVHLPATATTTANTYGGITTATTNVSGGGDVNMYCEAQITAAPNGNIVEIKPVKDTVGAWALSRCSEVFAERARS